MIAYLDSSALVKLVVEEAESDALSDELARWPGEASSDIARVELRRVVHRMGAGSSEPMEKADRLLSTVDLIHITEAILDAAGALDPPGLRSLDAVHLASAYTLGDQLGVLVTYDKRMLRAAEEAGLPTSAPA